MFNFASFLERASSAVGALGGANAGMPRRIWEELSPWLVKFASSATEKWLPVLISAEPCVVPRMNAGAALPCLNHAVTICDCCGRPVCIHHARVDQYGDAICYLCVAEAIQLKRAGAKGPGPGAQAPPPPTDMIRATVNKSLRQLGLKRGASWDEVKAAHRKLSAKLHPDRVQSESEKAKREAEFKKVQVAYQALERHYRDAPGAAA